TAARSRFTQPSRRSFRAGSLALTRAVSCLPQGFEFAHVETCGATSPPPNPPPSRACCKTPECDSLVVEGEPGDGDKADRSVWVCRGVAVDQGRIGPVGPAG